MLNQQAWAHTQHLVNNRYHYYDFLWACAVSVPKASACLLGGVWRGQVLVLEPRGPVWAQLGRSCCVSPSKSLHLSEIPPPHSLGGIKFVFLFICQTDGLSRYDHVSKCL